MYLHTHVKGTSKVSTARSSDHSTRQSMSSILANRVYLGLTLVGLMAYVVSVCSFAMDAPAAAPEVEAVLSVKAAVNGPYLNAPCCTASFRFCFKCQGFCDCAGLGYLPSTMFAN